MMTPSEKRRRFWIGSTIKGKKHIAAVKTSKVTQPCQVEGMPHPQPYFLAGNQYLDTSLFMCLILSKEEREGYYNSY